MPPKGQKPTGSVEARTHTEAVEATATVGTASGYASGDVVGGKLSFSNLVPNEGDGFVVQAAVLSDEDDQQVNMELWLFDEDPTGAGTELGDNNAFDLDDADLSKVVGVVSFSSFLSTASNGVAAKANLGVAGNLPNGTTLYGVLVARGALAAYATNDALRVKLAVLKD